MNVYARPKGTHYHTTKKCPLLSGKEAQMNYVEITWAAVRERKLRPCRCVKEK